MAQLYTGQKKYATIKKYNVNNEDIIITSNGTYVPDTDYTGFGTVRVIIPNPIYDTITASASTTAVTVLPEKDAMTKVIIRPVTATIDPDIKAQNIKKGINILGVTGTLEFITEEVTINPQTTVIEQTTSVDGISKVTVNAVTHNIDSDIKPENILKGINILGVTGTVIENKPQVSRKITANGTYYPDETYTGFSEVEVDVEVIHDPLTVTPSTTLQTFTSDSIYHGYSPVKVKAVTPSVDPNIVAGNIKQGVTILGLTGTCVPLIGEEKTVYVDSTSGNTFTPGTNKTGITSIKVLPTNQNKTITPSVTAQTINVPNGYSGFGTLHVKSVDNNIDTNIVSANIRAGVSILGVAGSCIELRGQERTISANGTFLPDSGYNAITSVTVDVDTVHNQQITILENGTYVPDESHTGFDEVTVDINTVNNTNITINPQTTTQNITVQEPYTGYETIKVNPVTSSIDSNIKNTNIKSGITILGVAGNVIELNGETRTETLASISGATYTPSSGKNAITSIRVTPKLQAKTLTVGSTTATKTTITPDSTYAGLGSVTLDMSWVEQQLQALNGGDPGQLGINLESKTITQAGTYTPSNGYDGFGTIKVDLTWVDQEIARVASDFTDTTADGILRGNLSTVISDATTIRDYACYYMNSLKNIRLNNATNIGEYAFANSGLETITISTTTMCSLSNVNAFDNVTLLAIKVPSSLVNSYKTATNWSTYSNIISAIS